MLLAAAVIAIAPFQLSAADQDEEKDEEAQESDEDLLNDIPIGETFQGLRIPQLSPEGKLLTLLDAKSAKRLEGRRIELTGLKIEFNNEDGTTFHVEMEQAVFDLDTRILTSDTPVTIKREDFVIDGDAAEFHTKTKFGRLTGNVKMVIFNTDNIE